LQVTTREKESIAKELEIAAQIQKKALPREMPVMPGLKIAAKSFPAKAVGGDYYDFVFPDENRIGFVIADAAGKGFPGSLYMSTSRSVFRVFSLSESSPAQMLKKTNDYLVNDSSQEGMFITYIFGIYDKRSKKLTYANAGHFPPLLYKSVEGQFEAMEQRGLPIGITDEEEYPEETIDFTSGDILVLYTDGVTEARNTQEEMFGVESLRELIQKNTSSSAQELVDKVSDAVTSFIGRAPQHDDITVVIIRAE